MFIWDLIVKLSLPIIVLHNIFYEASLNHFLYSSVVIMSVVIILVTEKLTPRFRKLLTTLSWLSLVAVLILSLIYTSHWCVILGCTGGLLNLTAVSANQGVMPVINPNIEPDFTERGVFIFGYTSWENIYINMEDDFRHKFVDSDTRLFCLCDWIVIRNYYIVSVGDMLIYSSGLMSLAHMVY